MSYCVNCGVKLDSALNKCPLCNTPVVNPNELKKDPFFTPFSEKSGQPEKVIRKDWGLLLTVVLTTTSLCCGLLNALVFQGYLWSLFIIGVCALIWVFAMPTIIYTKISIYMSLLFDGIAVGAFLFLITFVTPTIKWFTWIAMPITALVTCLALIFAFFYRKVSKSFLATALYIFIDIPILCIAVELLIRNFFDSPIRLTWSAVVLTICTIISIILITVLSKKGLRNAVRRRLHF